MIDYKKVLSGVNRCIAREAPLCPYYPCARDGAVECGLLADVQKVLKFKEPRVMTFDEVQSLTDEICQWMWIEERQHVTWNLHHMRTFVYSYHPDNGSFYIMANCHHDIVKLEGDEYNKSWRAWTVEPTHYQQEAVPWKD